MRGITEERLRVIADTDGSGGLIYTSTLLKECKELNPWQQIDEFEQESYEGWCWIVYKGRVVEAYHDHAGMYRFHRMSTNVYQRECIRAVIPMRIPHWQELPEDPK